MKIVKVNPIGEHNGTAFIGGHLREVPLPTYPPSPDGKRLRNRRVALGLSLREAAIALGVRAVELSELERGAARLSTAEEWNEAIRALGLPV